MAEPSGQRAVHQADGSCSGRLAQLRDRAQRRARLLQQLADAAGLVGGDHQRPTLAGQRDDPVRQAVHATRQRRSSPVPQVGGALLIKTLSGPSLEVPKGRGGGIRQRPGGWELPGGEQAVATLRGLAIQVGGDGRQLAGIGQHQERACREMVRGRPGGEERRPRLGRLARIALLEVGKVVGQRLRDRGTGGQARGQRREPGLRQELAGRQHRGVVQPAAARLGHRIEGTQRLEVVAKQLDPQRLGRSRGPEVDDPAPIRELPDATDLHDRLVATRHESGQELSLRDPGADTELQASGAELLRGDGPLHHGQQRGDDHEIARASTQLGQDPQALRGLLVLDQRTFQRQGRALRKDEHVPRDLPRGEVIGKPVRLFVVAHDDDQRGPGRQDASAGGQMSGPGRRRNAQRCCARFGERTGQGRSDRGDPAVGPTPRGRRARALGGADRHAGGSARSRPL